jgi:type IV secretory pathway VirB3-like protein
MGPVFLFFLYAMIVVVWRVATLTKLVCYPFHIQIYFYKTEEKNVFHIYIYNFKIE